MGIIAWIVFGFIIGLIARAVVPGKQGMGFVMTTLLGIAGSIVGGIVASSIYSRSAAGFQPAGFLGSILGAIIILVIAGFVLGPRRRSRAF